MRGLAWSLALLGCSILLFACNRGEFGQTGGTNAGGVPPQKTGGITAHAVWPLQAAESASNQRVVPYAAPSAVTVMRFIVQGPGMSTMQQDFDATLGTGTMSGIPVGDNRVLTMQGLDNAVTQTVLYAGGSVPVTVSQNATTDAGPVEMVLSSTAHLAPWPPTGVTATPADGTVVLSWNPSGGATNYNILWSTAPGVTFSNGTQILGADTPYFHTGLTNGTTYYYVVYALNTYGDSQISAQASAMPTAAAAAPAAPATVKALAGNQFVDVSWSAVNGATSYSVYRSSASPPTYVKQNASPILVLGYTDASVVDGTAYSYEVTASNALGEGATSSPVTATPSTAGAAASFWDAATWDMSKW